MLILLWNLEKNKIECQKLEPVMVSDIEEQYSDEQENEILRPKISRAVFGWDETLCYYESPNLIGEFKIHEDIILWYFFQIWTINLK